MSTWFSRFFFSHRDQDHQSLPFCKNGAYGFGVPRWQTSRTWGWDSLLWMAHSAFCRTILEAIVYSMMFTETVSSGKPMKCGHASPTPRPHHWFTSANHNPPPFCGLAGELAAHPSSVISLGGQHFLWSAILAKVAKRFCFQAQRSILNSHFQFTKKDLLWLNCLAIWDGLTAHLL